VTDKRKIITRDISWLAFNERVLQEAADESVPLNERIKFLGIFSSNLDEFFRVRVAALKRMVRYGSKANMHLEHSPEAILEEINFTVSGQQNQFNNTWKIILNELKKQRIFLLNDRQLNSEQIKYVVSYFNDNVRSYIVPLMIENLKAFPTLNDKSIYLACKLSKADNSIPQRYALVSIPARLPRFIILPAIQNNKYIILLEDIIRFCLPQIFSYFNYDTFSSNIVKVTRDAEMDIDSDLSTSLIQKIEKGLRNRKKANPYVLFLIKKLTTAFLTILSSGLNYLQKIISNQANAFTILKILSIFRNLFLKPKAQEKRLSFIRF
jgi:polyphosphate kinase